MNHILDLFVGSKFLDIIAQRQGLSFLLGRFDFFDLEIRSRKSTPRVHVLPETARV